MAPVPTPTKNATTSASVSPSAVRSSPARPPGQPVLLGFTILVFVLVCSAYFLYRHIRSKRLKKMALVSLSVSRKHARTDIVSTELATTALSANLYPSFAQTDSRTMSTDNGVATLDLNCANDVLTSKSASTTMFLDGGLDRFKIVPADIRSEHTETAERRSSVMNGLIIPLRGISAIIKYSLGIPASGTETLTCKPVLESIHIPELPLHTHHSSAANHAKSKHSRRHSIDIHDSARTSSIRRSVEPLSRHIRSISAPLTTLLSLPKKGWDQK